MPTSTSPAPCTTPSTQYVTNPNLPRGYGVSKMKKPESKVPTAKVLKEKTKTSKDKPEKPAKKKRVEKAKDVQGV